MRAALIWLMVIGCAPLWGAARFTDPYGFKDAAEMYRTAAVQPYDTTAAALVKAVDAGLKAKMSLEDDRVWGSLVKLNPYRKAPEVQAAIERWATFYTGEVRPYLASTGAVDAYNRANAAYTNGNFDAASRDYRKFLLKAWGHYDARNNLALAQLHLGNDLTAEMELLILKQLNDSYVPAAVNLTVVYERLGLEQKARDLAEQAAHAGSDVPQAVFNAAWFKDLAGSHTEALALLTPLAARDNMPPSVKSYRELLEKVTGKAPFSWRTGVAGDMKAYQRTAGMVTAVVVFTLFSLFVIAIAGRKRSRYAPRRKPGFWTFVVCVLLYLWFWGLSNPVWLLGTAFYAFLMLKISRARASR